MKMVVTGNLNAPKNFPLYSSSFLYRSLFLAHALSFPFRSNPSLFSPNNCLLVHAKNRNLQLEPLLKRTTTDQEDKEEVDEFQEGDFFSFSSFPFCGCNVFEKIMEIWELGCFCYVLWIMGFQSCIQTFKLVEDFPTIAVFHLTLVDWISEGGGHVRLWSYW